MLLTGCSGGTDEVTGGTPFETTGCAAEQVPGNQLGVQTMTGRRPGSDRAVIGQ
ncbi:hypothetical protein GCM10023215_09620 [Pseudonocardia yuanmonensis]|uniref:Uncharacterized protein n=1 Tax=Pseudonocardia yuanmonensis TaxID=1095914 RepID=A0ABP8W293_9PSEU